MITESRWQRKSFILRVRQRLAGITGLSGIGPDGIFRYLDPKGLGEPMRGKDIERLENTDQKTIMDCQTPEFRLPVYRPFAIPAGRTIVFAVGPT